MLLQAWLPSLQMQLWGVSKRQTACKRKGLLLFRAGVAGSFGLRGRYFCDL